MSNPSCSSSTAVADFRWFLLGLGLALAAPLLPQASLSVVADRDSVGIGETLILTLESDEPLTGGQTWAWPTWTAGDSLPQGWEVLKVGPVDSAASPNLDAGLRRTQRIEVLAWDSGFKVIEPLSLAGADGMSVASEALLVQVGSVALEDNPAPKPMQGYTQFTWTWWERALRILPYAMALLALAALLWWGYQRWSKREPLEAVADTPIVPSEPAHVVALRMLETLAAEQPWRHGRGKEAQAILSEAVRLHLQGTFGVKALERATEELSAHLLSAPIRGLDRGDASWLVDVLRQSDLVKFAKQNMAADAHARTVQEAIDWVRRTEPRTEDAPSHSTSSDNGHEDANLNSHG